MPIPRFTYMPSFNSCAILRAMPYLSKAIIIKKLVLLKKRINYWLNERFYAQCAFHIVAPGKSCAHIRWQHEYHPGQVDLALLTLPLQQLLLFQLWPLKKKNSGWFF